MKSRIARITLITIMLCSSFVLTTATAQAQNCGPGVTRSIIRNATYLQLLSALVPVEAKLEGLLKAVTDQTSYEALLTEARGLAESVANGRLVITLADGTVVVDTAETDDPSNASPTGNSYDHFQQKTVNENHNSRVAIFSAQLYPCGFGVETRLSTSTGQVESYVAMRLGDHLNSAGTARLSTSGGEEEEEEEEEGEGAQSPSSPGPVAN